MRKSHLISLFILFIAVSVLILVQAFTGPESKEQLSAPTRSPVTVPSAPTSAPSTATPTPPAPTQVVRPEVDLTQFESFSTKMHWWNVTGARAEDGYTMNYVVDPTVEAALEGISYFYSKPEGEGRDVYLTFNLAFENYETQILDVLKKMDVKASFFVSENYLELNTKLVQRILDEGHLIGTRGDIEATNVYAQTFCDTLWGMEETYQQYAGNTNRMEFYRPGQVSQRDLALAQAMGYKVALWSYAANGNANETKLLSDMINHTADGAIFQLYASDTQAAVMEDYISKALADGYTFKRLDQ